MLFLAQYLLYATVFITGIDSFLLQTNIHCKWRSFMRHQLSMQSVNYPTKIKDIVARMTQATQSALKATESRIQIELPMGVEFGVDEVRGAIGPSTLEAMGTVQVSNRQAARLFCEMFKVLAATTVVIFPTEVEATYAQSVWVPSFQGQIFSSQIPKKQLKKAQRGSRYRDTDKDDELSIELVKSSIPSSTEVLLVIAPSGNKDLRLVQELHEQFGPGTLIILINARFGNAALFAENNPESIGNRLERIFKSTFCYSTIKSSFNKDAQYLLFHEYGGSWSVAEKVEEKKADGGGNDFFKSITSAASKLLGQSGFTTLWTGDSRPGDQSIEKIIRTVAEQKA